MPGRHQMPPGTIAVAPERVSPWKCVGRRLEWPSAENTAAGRAQNRSATVGELDPAALNGARRWNTPCGGRRPIFLARGAARSRKGLPPPAAERRKVAGRPKRAIERVMPRGARPDHPLVARAERRGRRVRTRRPCFRRQLSPPADTRRASAPRAAVRVPSIIT